MVSTSLAGAVVRCAYADSGVENAVTAINKAHAVIRIFSPDASRRAHDRLAGNAMPHVTREALPA